MSPHLSISPELLQRFNSHQLAMLTDAFKIYCQQLGIDHIPATVDFELWTSDQIPKRVTESGTKPIVLGCLQPKPSLLYDDIKDDCRHDGLVLNYELSINLDEIEAKGSSADIFLTLAHECVHLKQWLNGELKLGIIGGAPKLYYFNQPVDPTTIPYADQPWEKEAHERMDGLLEDFVIEYKKRKRE